MSSRNLELAEKTMNDPRWSSVMARDPRADGQFFYSVKTTGVYCRPSCAARMARPENIEFHVTREAAEHAGYRPCKRCRPDQPSLPEQHVAMIERTCKFIENMETIPTLDELAEFAGMSNYHFHRVFKSVTGITPKEYATAHRAKRLRQGLEKGGSITDAIHEAGFGSSSRFYENSTRLLGMTPSAYRAGGTDTDIWFATGECSLGSILVACSHRGVCSIMLGADPDVLVRALQDRFLASNLIGGDRKYEQLIAKVVGFIEQPAIGLDLPLDIRGTTFQQRVWLALKDIPVGKTASYSEIANRIGSPKSARAVARACAANNIAIAIPCHRVIKNDGSISGYRWGIERKRALLLKEAQVTKNRT